MPIKTANDILALLNYGVQETLAQDNSALRTRSLVALALAFVRILEIGSIEERLSALELALKGGEKA